MFIICCTLFLNSSSLFSFFAFSFSLRIIFLATFKRALYMPLINRPGSLSFTGHFVLMSNDIPFSFSFTITSMLFIRYRFIVPPTKSVLYPASSAIFFVVVLQSQLHDSISGQFLHGSVKSAFFPSAACILRESICLNAHLIPMSLISCSVNVSPSFLVKITLKFLWQITCIQSHIQASNLLEFVHNHVIMHFPIFIFKRLFAFFPVFTILASIKYPSACKYGTLNNSCNAINVLFC